VVPGAGVLRLTRVAFFAISAVSLASGAHLAGGGTLSPTTALLSVPAVMLVMNLLAGAPRGLFILFLAMGFTQTALHSAFMALPMPPACVPAGSMGGTRLAGPHQHLTEYCEAPFEPADVVAGPPLSLLIAHSIATVLMAWLLAQGETAIWALASRLRFRIPPSGPRVVFLIPTAAAVIPHTTVRAPTRVHLDTAQTRGPPGTASFSLR